MPRNYENLWMMSRLHLVAGQLLTNKKDFKKLGNHLLMNFEVLALN